MFNDIGKKIMNYMKTICVIAIICIIISLVFDIISIASMHSSQLIAKYGANDAAAPILSSIFAHLLTAAGIYVGSWVLYAFGQLVDDVHAMRTNNAPVSLTVNVDGESKTVVTSQPSASSHGTKWKCAKCGMDNPVFKGKCQKCGADKYNRSVVTTVAGSTWTCAKCGSENPVSRVSCKNCGKVNIL